MFATWIRRSLMGIGVLCGVIAVAACGSLRGSAALPSMERVEGTWAIVAVDGQQTQRFSDQDTPELVFFDARLADNALSGRLGGSDGCNRLIGEFRFAEKGELRFANVGSTRMLCPFGDEQAQAIAKALHETTSWRLTRGKLDLMRQDSSVSMTLKKD